MTNNTMKKISAFALAAGLSFFASGANAALTPIQPAIYDGNVTHEKILESYLGTGLSIDGAGFVGGGFTIARIDDSADQTIFSDVVGVDEITDKYSDKQSTVTFADGKAFRMDAGSTNSSVPSENPEGLDHLVTYLLTGNGRNSYLLFWEDLQGSVNNDFDYNDVVVEAAIIPLPAAAWSGLVGLAGLGVFSAARKGLKKLV